MHEAVKRIHAAAEILRASQGIRLLQWRACGGLQAEVTDFYEWVRTVAQYNPSAGWVAGVVGVHPWELALCDAKLQREIYDQDADTWVASPYAPFGLAKAVDGGFLLRGEWPYSTGTHHCAWAVLGGVITDAGDAYREQLKTRVSVSGVVGKSDPFQQEALAEAESDLEAGIAHVDLMSQQMLTQMRAGQAMNATQRLHFRRNQVRAVQRVLSSVEKLLARAGSAAVWTTRPIEHYWRDLRTAAAHICNVVDAIYPAWANHELGVEAQVNAFY